MYAVCYQEANWYPPAIPICMGSQPAVPLCLHHAGCSVIWRDALGAHPAYRHGVQPFDAAHRYYGFSQISGPNLSALIRKEGLLWNRWFRYRMFL